MTKSFFFKNTTSDQIKTALLSIAPYIGSQTPIWSDRSGTFEMAGVQNNVEYTLAVSLQSENNVDTSGIIDFKFSSTHSHFTMDKNELTELYITKLRNALDAKIDDRLEYEEAQYLEVGKEFMERNNSAVVAIVIGLAVFLLIIYLATGKV